MPYDRIGVIGAMDSELAALIAALTQPAQETVQGLVFRTGRLGAREVVLVRCGIGKVSAARCTQVLIDRFAPGAVINTGIAGGLASGLAVGDIVVADGLVQHDFDAAPIGFVRGCVCMGDPGAPTVFAPDAVLSALLAQTAGNAIGAQRVHRGLVATGDQFISGAAAKAAIRRAFPAAMAAEMEGGAVAQAASMSGVRLPWCVRSRIWPTARPPRRSSSSSSTRPMRRPRPFCRRSRCWTESPRGSKRLPHQKVLIRDMQKTYF